MGFVVDNHTLALRSGGYRPQIPGYCAITITCIAVCHHLQAPLWWKCQIVSSFFSCYQLCCYLDRRGTNLLEIENNYFMLCFTSTDYIQWRKHKTSEVHCSLVTLLTDQYIAILSHFHVWHAESLLNRFRFDFPCRLLEVMTHRVVDIHATDKPVSDLYPQKLYRVEVSR